MEDRDPFKKKPALARTPPLANPMVPSDPDASDSVATRPKSRIAPAAAELVDSETPKRLRDPDSPSNKPRNTPPKKTKSNCQEVEEMGSILEELIYTFNEKQPVTRHINFATKSMLFRLRELQGTVHAQLSDVTNQLSEAMDRIEVLSQNPAVQNMPDEPAVYARPNCNAATQTTENLATKEPRLPRNNNQKRIPTGGTHEAAKQAQMHKRNNPTEADKHTSSRSLFQTKSQSATSTQDLKKNDWTEVKRKKQRPKVASRPDAIIVKCTEKTPYADILKMMNAEPTLQNLKGSVQGIRKSANGEMILRMQKQSDPATEQLHTALKAVLTDKAAIKSVHDTITIEVFNIDETISADEVLLALCACYEGDIPFEAVPTMRKAYGGKQIATLALQPSLATNLLDIKKVRIGWNLCQVRLKIEPKRCYRCMGYGHTSFQCKSEHPVPKETCFKCGDTGHTAKVCTNMPKCLLCTRQGSEADQVGHSVLSRSCPVYKTALKELKNG
ncbi:hypothetical protein ACLKA6_001519 [Drosophila palustris]